MPPPNSINHKIGIIGSINRDTIYQTDGSKVASWGGILYNIKYLSQNSDAVILPVANVGQDSWNDIIRILNRFKYLDLSHIKKVAQDNNHCFLHYHDQSHKCEILKGGVPRLTYKQICGLTGCEIILVNFISGRDIGLLTLEKLRSNYKGLIYMDIHSLTLGSKKVEGGYKRYLRKPENWNRYVNCADILQMNQSEFELISGLSYSQDNAQRFFQTVLKETTCLIITLGGDGCIIIHGHESPRLRLIPAEKVDKVFDTTGCGDAFAAGFINEYLRSNSFVKSAKLGNRLAASRCRIAAPMF